MKTFSKPLHHVHLKGWASPASPSSHRAAQRCRETSQALGTASLPGYSAHLVQDRAKNRAAHRCQHLPASARRASGGLLGIQTKHMARPTLQRLTRIVTKWGLATSAAMQITPQSSSWGTLTKVGTRDHPVARTQRTPDLSLHPTSAHGLRLATYLHSLCLDLLAS